MSELPRTWAVAPINDVVVDCLNRVPASDEEFKYIVISSIDRHTKSIDSPQQLYGRDAPSRARKLVLAGDVLVSMTRPNLNAVALVPEELSGEIASTGFDVLRAIEFDPRWLFYLVQTRAFVDRMSSLVRGALYPAVKSKDVRGFNAPFAPLNEQGRIADKLDAVVARVNACRQCLDRVSALLEQLRRAVLAAATSGELTKEWREDHQPDKEWLTVDLASVAHEFSYGSSAKSSKSGLLPVLRMGNIQDGRLDWTDLVYTSDPMEIAKYQLSAGDVLFNRTNSPELVPEKAHLHPSREPRCT